MSFREVAEGMASCCAWGGSGWLLGTIPSPREQWGSCTAVQRAVGSPGDGNEGRLHQWTYRGWNLCWWMTPVSVWHVQFSQSLEDVFVWGALLCLFPCFSWCCCSQDPFPILLSWWVTQYGLWCWWAPKKSKSKMFASVLSKGLIKSSSEDKGRNTKLQGSYFWEMMEHCWFCISKPLSKTVISNAMGVYVGLFIQSKQWEMLLI